MARSDRLAVRATLRQWNKRSRRGSDIAYLVYISILVGAIVLVPLIRAAWLLLSEPAAIAVLTAPWFGDIAVAASLVLMSAACAPWAAPAVRRAFLARVLSDAPAPFALSFGAPVVRWWLVAVVAAGAVAALVHGVLLSASAGSGLALVCATVSAIAAATLATVCAVAAQRSATVGNALSVGLMALAATVVVFSPAVAVFSQPIGAMSLGVLALIAACCVPSLLNSTQPHALLAASVRRDAAVVGFTLMDASVLGDAVRDVPRGRRRRSAVPRVPRALAFAVSAAVGAARTPLRLARGLIVLAGGFTLAAAAPSAWTVGLAAALVYLGIGACMTGVEQAALAARTPAVFGVSDVTLLARHAIFPAVVLAAASLIGLAGGPTGLGVALIVGVAVLVARVFAALTPPAPLELLLPMPTPAGDVGAFLRLLWALQGPIFAAALSIALLPAVLNADLARLVWAAAIAAALLIARWRTRS